MWSWDASLARPAAVKAGSGSSVSFSRSVDGLWLALAAFSRGFDGFLPHPILSVAFLSREHRREVRPDLLLPQKLKPGVNGLFVGTGWPSHVLRSPAIVHLAVRIERF